MLGKIRAIFRSLNLALTCTGHVLYIIIRSLIKGKDLKRALEIRKSFCQKGIKIMNTPLDKRGKVYNEGPAIFISNHRSYFDPLIALMDVKALPVARSDVSEWPLIGYGANVSGVMWVKRDSQNSRKNTMLAMKETLEMGYSILIYPEGTTTKEATTLEFKKGAFKMAIDQNVPIVPMAIEYENPDAVWDGPESFVGHFLNMFKKNVNPIKIRYGKPFYPEKYNGDHLALLADTQAWINKQIVEMKAEW